MTVSNDSPFGQRIAVVGVTCSGKSTLAQRLAGLRRSASAGVESQAQNGPN